MLSVSAGTGGVSGVDDLGDEESATSKTNSPTGAPGNVAYLNRDDAGAKSQNPTAPSLSLIHI